MRNARQWPPVAAAVLLVVLLVVAGLAGDQQRPMSIAPATARPGQKVIVHFQMPQQDASILTVENDGRTWLVQNDAWKVVNRAEGFYVGTYSPAAKQSSTTLTLPTSIESGSYQVCTLPLQHRDVVCATLMVS